MSRASVLTALNRNINFLLEGKLMLTLYSSVVGWLVGYIFFCIFGEDSSFFSSVLKVTPVDTQDEDVTLSHRSRTGESTSSAGFHFHLKPPQCRLWGKFISLSSASVDVPAGRLYFLHCWGVKYSSSSLSDVHLSVSCCTTTKQVPFQRQLTHYGLTEPAAGYWLVISRDGAFCISCSLMEVEKQITRRLMSRNYGAVTERTVHIQSLDTAACCRC